MSFLPMSKEEMQQRGWNALDFLILSGDAYVDHPSFGAAVIGRILEAEGFRVGIIAQPDWRDVKAFRVLGRPKLAVLVTGGNIDSMVNHYTAAKRPRSNDLYSPGGQAGRRPNRAAIVYANKVREAYKGVPIIVGGLEASLRRLAHYDYWSNKVRRSLLLDAKADLLIYGMAETTVREIAGGLSEGQPLSSLRHVRGTVYREGERSPGEEDVVLPSFAETQNDKRAYARSFQMQEENTDAIQGRPLWESYGDYYVVQNPPAYPLSQQQLDDIYGLPYTRCYHPSYESQGGIPALDEVKFSLISSRGCFGSCSFCALTFHQGRVVQARSHSSLLSEAKTLAGFPDFKGNIHDVGGPTANFRRPACSKQRRHGACPKKRCIGTRPCPQLEADHSDYLALLRKLRQLRHVKNVFVRSGIRFDYVLYDENSEFLSELVQHHISGQLKIAPEHVSPRVLKHMNKPDVELYNAFVATYKKLNRRYGKKQFLVPYFISSHPGSTLDDAIALAEYIRDSGQMPEQVQDFYPTPGTRSTCMYYTGLDPRTMESVYVPKDQEEKAMQRALLHYNRRNNYGLVLKALQKAQRQDLIGFGRRCLIPPPRAKKRQPRQRSKQRKNA